MAFDGFLDGCLFSVPWEAERCCQIQSSFVKGKMAVRSPEIKRVALGLAISMEAVEGVLAQVHRQGMTAPVAFVEGAATTELRRSALERLEQTQVTQHLFQGDLGTQQGKIDVRTKRCSVGRSGKLSRGSRTLDSGQPAF